HFEIFLQLRGRKFVELIYRNDFLRDGAVGFAGENGHRFARDEKENQKDHQDREKRNEENCFFREPFEWSSAMAATQSHPADSAFGFGGFLQHFLPNATKTLRQRAGIV